MTAEWWASLSAEQAAALWSAALLLWLASSIAWRRWRRKPLLAGALPDAVFAEGWASARMGSGLVARLGTARRCIHVQVTATALRLHPHFPFTLGFMPEVYDLDQVIPLQRLRSVTILGDGRLKPVEVKYTLPSGGEGTAQLLLKQAEAFVRATQRR